MRAASPLHPSIDLLGGHLAVMAEGRVETLAGVDPLARAAIYARHGTLNVIDLDAALGQGDHHELIREICGRHECYVGGGLRSVEDVVRCLDGGALKAILGSAFLAHGELDRSFLDELGRAVSREHLVFALDAERGELMTRAWTQRSGLRIEHVIAELEPHCSEFVITAIEREGTGEGPDLATLDRLRTLTRNPLLAAGGIATTSHVLALASRGVGAVLGQAVHLGELDLTGAAIALLDLARGETATARIRNREGRWLATLELDAGDIERAMREGRIRGPAPEQEWEVEQVRVRDSPVELHINVA